MTVSEFIGRFNNLIQKFPEMVNYQILVIDNSINPKGIWSGNVIIQINHVEEYCVIGGL